MTSSQHVRRLAICPIGFDAESVDLTCQHKNQALLVEGPEIMIRPIGTRPQSMRGHFSADQLQTMIDLYKS